MKWHAERCDKQTLCNHKKREQVSLMLKNPDFPFKNITHTHDLKHLGQSLSEIAFDSIHYPSFMFLTIHDFIKDLDPLWYGAVHKLCRLKISDFWPPPYWDYIVYGRSLLVISCITIPTTYLYCTHVCSCTYCHVFACDFFKIEYYLTDIYKS